MPSHLNCVDMDGNNILMIFLETQFKDPNNTNKQNSQQIIDFINLFLFHEEFRADTLNDFNETASQICVRHMKTNAKNKIAQDILKGTMFVLSQKKKKTWHLPQKTEHVTPIETARVNKGSCRIL